MEWFRNIIALTVACLVVVVETIQINNFFRNLVVFDYYDVMYRYDVQPATSRNPKSVSVSSVQITLRAAPTSIYFHGVNTWQAQLYVAEREDGSGLGLVLSNQLLGLSQASTSVFPRRTLDFLIKQRFNLDGYGPGTALPYLCTEFMTTLNADVEFRFGNSRSAVHCESIASVPKHLRAVLRLRNSHIFITQTDRCTAQVTTTVTYDVIFVTSSDVIQDNPLWQLRMFGSENPDGTGRQSTISEQLLNQNQVAASAIPGGQLRFTTCDCFDLSGLGPGTPLPFICLSLEKHSNSDFEVIFLYGNDAATCKALPAFVLQKIPRAVVRWSRTYISFYQIDSSSTHIITKGTFDVSFDDSSDVIDGNSLWQLQMLASENIDGTGRKLIISTQLLDGNQISTGVIPGVLRRFTTMQSFDFWGFGPGTSLPCICLSLAKHPAAKFEFIVGDNNVITGCRALPPFAKKTPRAVVEQSESEIFIRRSDQGSSFIDIIVNYTVSFDASSDPIDDDHLWQVKTFASQNADGTGRKRIISKQPLDGSQVSGDVRPRGKLHFTSNESFEIKELGTDESLPYICVSLQKNPNADFEIVFGDTDIVTICEEAPKALSAQTSPTVPTFVAGETMACRIWGDPHQKTFDGYGYSFQGETQHVAVKTCKDNDGTMPEFQIIAENYRRRPSQPVTFIRELKLEYNGVVYSLIHPNTILVDGVAVTSPFSDENGVKIYVVLPHKILTTNFGLVMRLDDGFNSDITLPVEFANKVCGLCGNFDGIRENECHFRDGTSMKQRNERCKADFIQQWLHNATELPYRDYIRPLNPCDNGSAVRVTAEDSCNILIDPTGPLADCLPFVSPYFYFGTCVFDLCQMLPSTAVLCGHIEAYILDCLHVTGGAVEIGSWRDVTEECERKCGKDMTFTYRGNPCPPTCMNPNSTEEDCPFSYLESCQCDEGKVLDGMRCVKVTDCGCQMEDGRYLSIGEEYISSDCSEACLCRKDHEIQCTSVTCAEYSECAIKSGKRDCYCKVGYTGPGREECTEALKICRIYGGSHFNTFDQDFYSFQGDCSYTAVRTCKTLQSGVFPFQIHISSDALVPGERYTYRTLIVRLHFKSKIYRISYGEEVSIDDVSITNSIPFRDRKTGVHILKYMKGIVLNTDGGLHINLTSDNEVTIELPPVYFEKVCGLCGNADGNSKNDKQLPDGTLHSNEIPFVFSWSNGSCTLRDDPVESCVVGSDEEAKAIDICSDLVRKDGPFAHCYDFRDPTHFYESCVFDLCATLPSTELFCVSTNRYLQACMENGGSVQGDWKRAVEYCSSVNCPRRYTPFQGSCYRHYKLKKNYEQSKNFCFERGEHLVTITSREENDFVSKLSKETTSWIGAERNHSASFKTYTSYGNDSYKFLPKRIPRGAGSIRLGVVAQSTAYIILSPTRNLDETTPLYEFEIGNKQNKTFLRRCMSCPEEDYEQRILLKAGEEKRFFINFHDGIIKMGRYKKRGISLRYTDENPIIVKYIAFKTVGSESTWNFYDNEFMWITNETWGYDNYRHGEPSNANDREHCLETNYDSNPGSWNDHFCSRKKFFVCEVKGS